MTVTATRPAVSVIIPARNAASTLSDTIAALLSQTSQDWEAIVIDDGSTDQTSSVAEAFASRDARIRVLVTAGAGVSAARNAGIQAASAEWLLFLDADDWVLPAFVERLTQGAARHLDAAVIYCGWMRVAPGGRIVTRDLRPPVADMYPTVARLCPFAVHSCIVRRSEVLAVGGFDESLIACEDWDLWQRIARRGSRFAQVADFLSCYRMREDSASIDAAQMLADGLRVITRGHGADPRIDPAAAKWPVGLPQADLARTRLGFCSWPAGLAIAKGNDPVELLAALTEDRSPEVDPSTVADALFRSIPLRSCRGPEAWVDLWPEYGSAVCRFVDALEQHSKTPWLRARTMAIFARLVVAHAPILPSSAGRQHAVAIEASRPITGLALPADAERVLIVVTYADTRLGTLELPVCDGAVPAAVVSDAVAATFMWPILARLLAPVYASLRIGRKSGQAAIYRQDVCLTTDGNEQQYLPEELHDRVGWTVFLQELFDRPDISDAGLYDETWADPHRAAVRTVHDGEWIRVEATAEIPQLRGPAAGVLVELTVGGAAIALVPMDVGRRGVRAHALRTQLIVAGGLELARAAVREGVLMANAANPCHWRDQLVRRAAEAPALAGGRQSVHTGLRPGSEEALARALAAGPASLLVGRRTGLPVGSTASRHATFPAIVAADLRDAALAAGELVVDLRGESPLASVAYVPDVFMHPGAPSAVTAAESRPGAAANVFGRHHFETIFAAPDPWKYATAYEQTKYDQTLSLLPHQPIERALEVGCAEGHFTARLAGRVGQLTVTDISHVALDRAAARCRDFTNVTFERLDLVADALPPDQDLVVCSEMLYYVGDRRQLAVAVAKLRDALKPGGYLLSAHANTTADKEAGAAFEWDVPFGAKTIGEVMGRVAGLSRVSELRTALYRIFLFRRSQAQPARRFNPFTRRSSATSVIIAEHAPLTPEVASHVRWHKSSSRGSPPPAVVTDRLPILMYHRIASAGTASTAPYRVSPRDFEEQLRYLHDVGFRSISLDEWRQARDRRRPVDGRALVITFDDGFADFEEEAWPLLRKYGFGAIVFVVTDLVGGSNAWDAALCERVPLMDWPALVRLEASGVEFGGHSATHRAMTGLSIADVVREASRCRTALLSHLRHPVPAFAYPFGDGDAIVQHLVGACGYGFGVTCEPRRSRADDALMALPRVEVRGTDTLADFIAKLTED